MSTQKITAMIPFDDPIELGTNLKEPVNLVALQALVNAGLFSSVKLYEVDLTDAKYEKVNKHLNPVVKNGVVTLVPMQLNEAGH